MYHAHFGLAELPFSLTPDTDYFYALQPHNEALQVLLTALEHGEGFIKVIGEVGTGKTMTCRKLLNALTEDFQSAYLPNPCLSPQEITQALANELGIDITKEDSEHSLLSQRLQERLLELAKKEKKVVLVIDEAQALSFEALEAIRLFGNLETEKQKLLHIVLFAQPELDSRLQSPELRQLNQRITFSYELRALNQAELIQYIEHRLHISGYRGAPMLTNKTYKLLFKATGGIPRLINILCHKSLMLCYGKGERVISKAIIKAAIKDTPAVQSNRKIIFKFLGAACLLLSTTLIFNSQIQLSLGGLS